MRKCLLLGLGVGLALLAGCATVTKTADENVANQKQIVGLEMRQIADDWNLIWMTDRQNRLSRWITR
jgi:uncharacterized protein YceK